MSLEAALSDTPKMTGLLIDALLIITHDVSYCITVVIQHLAAT